MQAEIGVNHRRAVRDGGAGEARGGEAPRIGRRVHDGEVDGGDSLAWQRREPLRRELRDRGVAERVGRVAARGEEVPARELRVPLEAQLHAAEIGEEEGRPGRRRLDPVARAERLEVRVFGIAVRGEHRQPRQARRRADRDGRARVEFARDRFAVRMRGDGRGHAEGSTTSRGAPAGVKAVSRHANAHACCPCATPASPRSCPGCSR